MTNKAYDPIVEEIRRRREAHAHSLGYDLKRITEDLQQRERESGAVVVDREPRKAERVPQRSPA